MCGNTIGQDRRFLVKYLPKLEAYFHYRNVDVSTLKELAKRWKPEVCDSFKKAQKHTALADVHESIDELEHYRRHLLGAAESGSAEPPHRSPVRRGICGKTPGDVIIDC